MEESSCREACRLLGLPAKKLLGGFACYKNYLNNCFQDGENGGAASLICKRSIGGTGKILEAIGIIAIL